MQPVFAERAHSVHLCSIPVSYQEPVLYDRKGVLRKKVIGFEYTEVFESELKALL